MIAPLMNLLVYPRESFNMNHRLSNFLAPSIFGQIGKFHCDLWDLQLFYLKKEYLQLQVDK